jgi:hypothetical protein
MTLLVLMQINYRDIMLCKCHCNFHYTLQKDKATALAGVDRH